MKTYSEAGGYVMVIPNPYCTKCGGVIGVPTKEGISFKLSPGDKICFCHKEPLPGNLDLDQKSPEL